MFSLHCPARPVLAQPLLPHLEISCNLYFIKKFIFYIKKFMFSLHCPARPVLAQPLLPHLPSATVTSFQQRRSASNNDDKLQKTMIRS